MFGTGRGMQGLMLPGCPETFQSSQQSQQQQQQEHQGQGQRSHQDRHQRLQQFRKGDIIAIPAGAAHWMYNDGENDLVAVVLLDNANNANQLDQNPRVRKLIHQIYNRSSNVKHTKNSQNRKCRIS